MENVPDYLSALLFSRAWRCGLPPLWLLAPARAGGAEAQSLESGISLKKYHLMDRDDPVSSHGPEGPELICICIHP
jgi:hypothetical protein